MFCFSIAKVRLLRNSVQLGADWAVNGDFSQQREATQGSILWVVREGGGNCCRSELGR